MDFKNLVVGLTFILIMYYITIHFLKSIIEYIIEEGTYTKNEEGKGLTENKSGFIVGVLAGVVTGVLVGPGLLCFSFWLVSKIGK